MNNAIRAINIIHADRAARFQGEAGRNQLAAEIRRARRAQADEHRVRRVIGRRIVRLGTRLAGEPAPDPCPPAVTVGGRGTTYDGALLT